jgi:hypothetical protein
VRQDDAGRVLVVAQRQEQVLLALQALAAGRVEDLIEQDLARRTVLGATLHVAVAVLLERQRSLAALDEVVLGLGRRSVLGDAAIDEVARGVVAVGDRLGQRSAGTKDLSLHQSVAMVAIVEFGRSIFSGICQKL